MALVRFIVSGRRNATCKLLIYWIHSLGHRFTSFRHHRFRQRHSAIPLQCGAPIVWRRQSTFDDRHRCVRRLVISLRTHSFGQRRFIFLPAIIAAHHFLLIYRDRDGRLPCKLRVLMRPKDRVNSPLASQIRTIMPGLKFPMAASHFLRSGISRNRISSVAAKGFRLVAGLFIFFITRLAALLSRLAGSRTALRCLASVFSVFLFLFLILFALPSEDHVFDFEQRDLLFLQLRDYIQEGSQESHDQSSLSFFQFVLLKFLDQNFNFGWIDLWNLV